MMLQNVKKRIIFYFVAIAAPLLISTPGTVAGELPNIDLVSGRSGAAAAHVAGRGLGSGHGSALRRSDSGGHSRGGDFDNGRRQPSENRDRDFDHGRSKPHGFFMDDRDRDRSGHGNFIVPGEAFINQRKKFREPQDGLEFFAPWNKDFDERFDHDRFDRDDFDRSDRHEHFNESFDRGERFDDKDFFEDHDRSRRDFDDEEFREGKFRVPGESLEEQRERFREPEGDLRFFAPWNKDFDNRFDHDEFRHGHRDFNDDEWKTPHRRFNSVPLNPGERHIMSPGMR